MTQPPEGRDPTVEGSGQPATPAPDDPTVPWTPPDEPVATDAPGSPPAVAPPAINAAPPADAPIDAAPPSAEPPPASPLISWAPSGTTTPEPGAPLAPGIPGAPTPPATAGPVVGWQVPSAAPAAAVDGFGYGGVFARLVAWMVDGIIVGIVPGLLQLLVLDWQGLMRQAMDEAIRQSQTGVPAQPSTFTTPITTEFILVTLVSVGINFLYFVGFWTSGWQATPGMRGLKMRVVDATGGTALSLVAATKRWAVLGAPLAAVGLIEPLQSVVGILGVGLLVVIFLTAATDDRKQGLHDKVANSLVIRSLSSGAGATAIGCLVLIAISIGLAIVFGSVVFNEMLPIIEEYAREQAF